MHQGELNNVFSYHAPQDQAQIELYATIRAHGLTFATFINENVPDGDEKEIAINKLREAVMWANAGIACGGQDY